MLILQGTDIHGSERGVSTLNSAAVEHSPDVVVLCGDITSFGSPPGFAERLLTALKERVGDLLAVPGNCDPRDIIPLMESMGVSLHGRARVLHGERFFGFGGSPPTEFGPMYTNPEETIRLELGRVASEGGILVVHAPPFRHLDSAGGMNAGSTGVSRIVEEFRPRLVLSGHIHEAVGVERSGPTTFVNPGPAKDGHFALIRVGSEVRVELMR